MRTLATLGAAVLLAASCNAAILEVGGNVSGTWNSENEYHVIESMIVPGGETLSILPGTRVLFMGGYSLKVYGTLLATGSENARVEFTSGLVPPQRGDWSRIQFIDGGSGLLSFVTSSYAGTGVNCDHASPTIENSVFTNCINGISGVHSYPTLSNVESSHNSDRGLYVYACALMIDHSLFVENGDQGVYGRYSTLTIENTVIAGNYKGLSLDPNSVSYCSNSIIAFNNRGLGGNINFTCTDAFGNGSEEWDLYPDQLGVNGNICEDPMFCDFDLGDYGIGNDSPCAPDNNDCGVLMGAWPVGCSTSAESATWSEVKALF